MCRSFKSFECGRDYIYSSILLTVLLPVLFLRSMRSIGFFSLFILCFTFVAVVIIIYFSVEILKMSPAEVREKYGLDLKDEDRVYTEWDTLMIPIFAASMMTPNEGNQQILNIYAEADKPEDFYMLTVIVIVFLSLIVSVIIGYLGYLAFGAATKSLILFNLPNEDPASITAKLFYILTILGSFVVVAMPVYRIIESYKWYRYLAGLERSDHERAASE